MSIHTEHELQAISTGNKRKRANEEADIIIELDQRPFTIKADTANPFAKPPTFLPLCLLPRASLPLAHLDPLPNGNRLFSAHIHSLEAAVAHDIGPTLLIAQNEREGRLYAVERVHRRTYALCRLRSDLQAGDLPDERHSKGVVEARSEKVHTLDSLDNGKTWWTQAAVTMPPTREQTTGAPQLNIITEEALVPREQTVAASQNSDDHAVRTTDELSIPTTPQDHLQELAKQYLEALYITRTSLAYFSKGPLSRARAAFSSNGAAADVQSAALTTFLREAILTASLTDKKYRETICDHLKNIPSHSLQTPDEKPKVKRKRKWKPKRDKAGMFVDESEYVERWWSNEAVSGASTQDADDDLVSKTSRLRSRETYLQVILALEVLALESATTSNNPQPETQCEESQAEPETKKSKVKKPQDLQALLEALVERLCIWHSLDFISPAAKKSDNPLKDDSASSNDELRNFCVEVIIPFYMSRIPKAAAMVNKRLGGPSAPAASKRRQATAPKPGEAAVRQAPEKKPRRLARTPTDTLSKQARLPQLVRAATDMTAIKREGSVDIALTSIPYKADQFDAPPRKRVSVMDSLKARQVDFSAVSQVNDAKLRKKAEMQERVKEAVDAIRKPNRDLATQETAETVDASFAKATASKGRIQKKKEATTQRISIEATPKHPRAIKATPAAQRRQAKGLPSSGSSMVPASSMKGPSSTFLAPPSSICAVPATGHRPRIGNATGVEETPSRGFGKFLPQPLVHEPGTLVESPLATRRGLQDIRQTPVKPMKPLALVAADVSATPVQPLRTTTEPGKTPQETSVYASLGWDDDDYEELA